MKEYRVKHDTIIEGKPLAEGATLKLSDDKAKVYKSASLIEDVKDDKDGKSEKSEAEKIDTSRDKRVEKSKG